MSKQTSQLSHDLFAVLAEEAQKLAAYSEADACARSGGGAGWTRKQELGHLLDSATNNRVRFASAALADTYTGPTYDGDGWVALGGYDKMPWNSLVDLWRDTNMALARLIANIPDEKLTVHCQVGSEASVTLGFLIEDYTLHLQHHLDHLLGREASSSYPGASMGV